MIGGEFFMSMFRSVFREQKTRLRIDWLTHTDELILEYLTAEPERPPHEIANEIDRSIEYVSDRCRQLSLRGLLEEIEAGVEGEVTYRVDDLGRRYLAGDVDVEELEELAG